MLPTKIWGVPTDMKQGGKGDWTLPVSVKVRVDFPSDLRAGSITFIRGRCKASLMLKTDQPYRAVYEKGRLYYMNESRQETFCYYLNQGDQRVREFILVRQRPESKEALTYTWTFKGSILEYGKDGSILVYEKNVNAKASKTRFEALDSSMQNRIRRTLKKELGEDLTFSGKGRLLFTIPAPFYVDGHNAVEKKNISYTIDDPSTLSLTVTRLHGVSFPLLIDPTIDASDADIKLVGEDAGDNFGYSVSGAGDFNGDGKDDVIVGAYYDNDGGSDSGCAFIFYGGASSGTIDASNADIKLVGEDMFDNFGHSVSGAGDFNGDGKDDVIVGALYDDDGGSNSGCAFIFYGGASSGTIDASNADIKLVGEDGGDNFGHSVSGAGDFNGDGKGDVIVGARQDDDGGVDSGCAFIFYGGASSGTIDASNADIKLVGEDADDKFGRSVSGAGDFNGDGKDDVIVGAINDDDGGVDSGCAFIFYGGASSGTIDASSADIKLVGEDADDRFGYSVSGAGDFNGDGKDDVIVGANGDDDGGGSSGCAFIFFGENEVGDELAVDFGDTYGLYYYDGSTWSQANVEWLAVYGDKLVGDFGDTYGLHEYNGTSWTQISEVSPDNTGNTMVAYGNGLAVDSGDTYGLYYYDGSTWSQLSAANVEWLAVYGDKLVGDFGDKC
jgi:hypothetical protein